MRALKLDAGSIVVVIVLMLLVNGCGAAPAATVDQAALEATITAKVIATQTANAPKAVATTMAVASNGLPNIPPKKNYKHNYTIDVTYDNVRDSTTVLMSPPIAEVNNTPNNVFADFVISGNKTGTPLNVFVGFMSHSVDWQYLSTSSIDWLLNGAKRFSLKGQHDGKVGSGFVSEWIIAPMPTAQLLDVVNASTVEIAIASFQFSLTATQLEALKDFASRMNP